MALQRLEVFNMQLILSKSEVEEQIIEAMKRVYAEN